MLKKITCKIKSLGIKIKYCYLKEEDGIFDFFNNIPIIFINENLNELDTALVLLHETAHFLNGDCDKYITNRFQNDNLEHEANRFMIHEVIRMLDQEYDFTPEINYQKIIDSLNLPYYLDGVIFDEFFDLIQDKFGMEDNYEMNY